MSRGPARVLGNGPPGNAACSESRPGGSVALLGDVATARFMHTWGSGWVLGTLQPISTLPHPLDRMRSTFRWLSAGALGLAIPFVAPRAQAVAQSAPISGIRYDVTFDSRTAPARTLRVGMTFDVGGPGTVLLSLPAWTPGAYEISNFARWVSNFSAAAGEKALTWDKLDYDTWRIRPDGAKSITVTFDYLADSLDNAMTWSRGNF